MAPLSHRTAETLRALLPRAYGTDYSQGGDGRTVAKTGGEELFEQYLADRGIGFDYEVGDGERRPDYRLATSPVIHCEVKDFLFGPHDRAEWEAFRKGNRVGSKGPGALSGSSTSSVQGLCVRCGPSQ